MTQELTILVLSLAIVTHILTVILLSLRQTQVSQSPSPAWAPHIPPAVIHLAGLTSALITLVAPYMILPDDPIAQPALRCVSFFYACKILDLSLARAHYPPTVASIQDSSKSNTDSARSLPNSPTTTTTTSWQRHTYLLLTEMRYQSFNIPCTKQKDRLPSPTLSTWTILPPLIIPLLVYTLPTPQTKALLVLLLIQLSLETLHTILHLNRSSCKTPLFYKPFAARTFSAFWTTHWHAAAAPFLQTLAYQPGKRHVGRWFGVLATFNLTGIWHAWAAAPLVEGEFAWELGFKVWAMFMVMGLGILGERLVWGQRQGGLVQRVVVWVVAIFSAGWAFRTLECHSRIALLRDEECRSR